jgi:glycolate oxidase iron-sulfur subunit
MLEAGAGYRGLDPCVHCGFCLPACPTYLATGDENDSPRGRIVLIRALERGELAPTDPDLRQHLDACLACRGCEPACPSGVAYGRGIETARRQLATANGVAAPARAALAVFGNRWLWRTAFGAARLLRSSGIAGRLAGPGRVGMALGMTAATAPARRNGSRRPGPAPAEGSTVALFRGCVMDTLFDHVHEATIRVLEANGYRVVEVSRQACCGAPHDHNGAADQARALAHRNVEAFGDRADWIVVNSAGCGALLKDYGHLLGTEPAGRFAARVRDVTELLAASGPRPGRALPLDVAYDAPCHLQHAQRVHADPLTVLGSIPGLRLHLLPGYDRCCGGAGTYGLLHPEMSAAVLADKVAAIREADPRPAMVTTGNPGCIMQIGAGLRAAGLDLPVVHPVELLDWSYAD